MNYTNERKTTPFLIPSFIFQKFTLLGALFKDDIWSILAAATATTTSKGRLCEVKS
jgi:hypothetical protein